MHCQKWEVEEPINSTLCKRLTFLQGTQDPEVSYNPQGNTFGEAAIKWDWEA